MKITTLIENTKPEGTPFAIGHGLGLYVETNGLKLLFDNGPDDSFVENAALLGIDLKEVDLYVLSHAHYDHGGGLRTFLSMNGKATVWLSEFASDQCYSVGRTPEPRYIGIDSQLFEENSRRLRFVANEVCVNDSIRLFSVHDFNTFRPQFNSLLYTKRNGEMMPDDFRHELVMAITESGQNTIFTGCAHSGILNMVRTVQEKMPDNPVHAVVGGFHLLNTATKLLGELPETVRELARELNEAGVDKILTGHCTGTEGFELLKGILHNKLEALSTGKRFEI
ncbi:MAG: metallo-beta-lactamase family protein [Bacteroidetes bacterium]|nr:metallo-beta-lactamase family protein [Bacteroidota bacterium]